MKTTGSSGAKRLVCVVEGQGDAQAVPCLCARVRDKLEAWDWIVDQEPVRQPRSKLVDERVASPARPAALDGMRRAVELARRRPADAVLVVCDSDDDCAATWGVSATAVVAEFLPGGAVMAVREYESWLLCSELASSTLNGRDIAKIRDAKRSLAQVIPGYKPTLHQARLTRKVNLDSLWSRSDSFDKLVRTLSIIFGTDGLTRPLTG
jgi:hypothetical protein